MCVYTLITETFTIYLINIILCLFLDNKKILINIKEKLNNKIFQLLQMLTLKS